LAARLNQGAPTNRNFRFAKQFARQNQKEQVRAAIANKVFKFRAVEEAILQGPRLPHYLFVTAVFDRFEIVRVELGKKRIRNAEGGIMNPEISLQDFAAFMNFFQTARRRRSAAVVAAKVDQRLFAF